MDLNSVRTILLVLAFIAFIGIIWWAWSPKSKPRFDEAANLPFADDDMQQRTVNQSEKPESRGE